MFLTTTTIKRENATCVTGRSRILFHVWRFCLFVGYVIIICHHLVAEGKEKENGEII